MNTEIENILYRSIVGSITGEEERVLSCWLKSEENRELYDRLHDEDFIMEHYIISRGMNVEQAYVKVKERCVKHTVFKWNYVAAAAVVLLIGFTSLYLVFGPKRQQVVTEQLVQDLLPGKGGVKLITSLNQEFELGNADSLDFTKEFDGVQLKNKAGKLSYEQEGHEGRREVTKHTLEVSRGGEYKLQLADGTMVYLNSDSKLVYPTDFIGDKREVYLEGEAFFDVKPNQEKPFVVNCGTYDVRVLGTSFNIMNYKNEAVSQTTLVTGSIELQMKNRMERLKPGEQAVISDNTLEVRKVNVNPYISWKESKFSFANETLESVMRKLARWYDVEVFYVNTEVKDYRFSGYVPRYAKITDVFELIELSTKVRFDLKGRTVTVSKQR